jgi:hypothetical protein
MDTEFVQLADVRELPFAEGVNPILARCAQQVIDSLDDPDGVISAFQSFVTPADPKGH